MAGSTAQAILPRMDWSGPWWLVVLGLGLALLIATAVYARRSRSSGFAAAAAQLGFRAFSDPTPFSPEERKGLNLFSRGYGGKWTNMFADNPETPSALFFDFSYRFGLRFVASVGYRQNVAAFSVRLTSLPDFQLTPATALDRIAPKLGLQAIRFESRPEFGRKYWLRATDEIPVRALFTDLFIDHLSTTDPRAAWYVEKTGRWLIIYQHGKSFAPPHLPHFLQASRAMADLFLAPH
jgi:hypothetical protein